MSLISVTIYACPTPGCGNYYASSSGRPLEQQQNTRSAMRNLSTEDPSQWGAVTGTRDECPDCRARGKTVKRVPVTVQVDTAKLAGRVVSSLQPS